MICPACGRNAPASEAVCTACGAVLADGATIMPPVSLPKRDEHADVTQFPMSSADGATIAAPPAPDDTGPLKPGAEFGSRYHIIRILGVGGMGAVYQAWDAELGVAVAIKVIRPEIMGDPHAAAEVERRFKRELLLARQ